MDRVAYVLACLLLPIVWGALVHWGFDLWQGRSNGSNDETGFPDYQI